MGSLEVYRRPSPGPHTRPELRFLQVYDEAAIATGVEVTQFAAWTGGFHGFRSINGRLVRFGQPNTIDPMLIVCPSCSTSYTIEPASLGSAGRTVRCARCKTTWFADTSPAEVTALADGAIDESDAHESPGVIRPDRGPAHAGDMEPAESAIADEPTPEPAESPAPPAAIADAPSLVPGIEPASSD